MGAVGEVCKNRAKTKDWGAERIPVERENKDRRCKKTIVLAQHLPSGDKFQGAPLKNHQQYLKKRNHSPKRAKTLVPRSAG